MAQLGKQADHKYHFYQTYRRFTVALGGIVYF